jgi:hypothetical protein
LGLRASELDHPFGARRDADRMQDERRVVFFKGGIESGGDVL